MAKTKLVISLIVFFVALSCKTIKIDKPKEEYVPMDYKPKISIVNLPIDIDIKKIEISVNDKFKGLIYEDNNLEDDNLQIKLWKSQNFSFNAVGSQIQYKIPLKIWSKFGWKIEKFGFSVSDYYEATGEIALKYKTSVSVTKDWVIKTTTTSDGYEWIKKPSLSVGGITIPVTSIANIALKSCSGLINTQIDKTVTQSVPLKKYVQDAWVGIQTPMNVNKDYNVWLKIEPKELFCAPMSSANNHLNLSIGVKSIVESYIGHQPEASVNNTLPNLGFVKKSDDKFILNFSSDITFNQISEVARKELIGKEFSQGKKKVIINNLEVFGSEGKMMFVANLSGSVKGTVYFSGAPEYNKETSVIEIKNIDFEINTRNVLVKSANWLLHGTFLKMIEPNLKFPISDQVKDMKSTINNELKNYKVIDGILLNCNVSDIVIDDFWVVQGALKLIAHVEGKLNIKVEDIKL